MATTFDTYLPFDSGPGGGVGEAGWRRMARHFRSSGVLIDQLTSVADWASALLPFGDGTGMQVKVNPGEVWANGHLGVLDTQRVLPIASNVSGSTRYDLIVARADYVANVVELDIVQGTPGGAIPTPANDTTRYEVRLGFVIVASGAVTITSANVGDYRILAGNAYSTFVPTMTLGVGGSALAVSSAGGVIARADRLVRVQGWVLPTGTWATGEWALTLPMPLQVPVTIDGVGQVVPGSGYYSHTNIGSAFYRAPTPGNSIPLQVVIPANGLGVVFRDPTGTTSANGNTSSFGNASSQRSPSLITPATPAFLSFEFEYVAER